MPPINIADAVWKQMLAGQNNRREQHDKRVEVNVGRSVLSCTKIQLDPSSKTSVEITPSTDENLRSLNYSILVKGDVPANGYPLYLALHGGGGTSTGENNSAWAGMAGAYTNALPSGVWLALRGIGDSWDLHFTRAGYVLVETLIENMIMFGIKKDGQDCPIDSNRVYLHGFSAGGDGVYRLGPRLAQRFAAISAGGGHPGWDNVENLTNLMNVPFILQIGEQDTYLSDQDEATRLTLDGRNIMVAKAGAHLKRQQQLYGARVLDDNVRVYVHKLAIHPTAKEPDNETLKHWNGFEAFDRYDWKHFSWEGLNWIWDGQSEKPMERVLDDPLQWLKEVGTVKNRVIVGEGRIEEMERWARNYKEAVVEFDGPKTNGRQESKQDTNIITWLSSQPARDPAPPHLTWDIVIGRIVETVASNDNFSQAVFMNTSGRGQSAEGRSQFYWLDIGSYTPEEVGPRISARLIKDQNAIRITSAKKYLRILLRSGMLDLSQTIYVQLDTGSGSQTLPIKVNANNPAVVQDTLHRRDPEFVFTTDIILEQDPTSGRWSASSTPLPSA